MTKNRAKRGFIILSIVLAIGLFLTFCPFYISFNYSTFNGFFNSIPLGTDLAGGVYSVYECSLNTYNGAVDFDKEMDATVKSLQSTLNGMGYNSAIVSKLDDNKIRVETAKYKDLQSVEDYIGTYASIYISSEKIEDDFSESKFTTSYITTKNISRITNMFAGAESTFNIMMYFDGEGKTLYQEITKEASSDGGSGNVYIYVIDNDGEAVEINNGSKYIELECSAESTNDYIGFSSNGFNNQNVADIYTLPYICATFGVKMNLVETEEITPVLGESAMTLLIVAMFIALAAAIAILVIRYGDFGLIAGLSAVFFLVVYTFLIQAIPGIVVSLGSLFAIILSYILLFDGFVIIFEKTREEYRIGKKMPLAVRGGFQKAVWPIVDTNLILSIFGLALCFFGSSLLTSIGFLLLSGSLLSMFTSLVFTKLTANWYLCLNSIKANRVNLEKDKTLVIKDEIVIDNPEEGGTK